MKYLAITALFLNALYITNCHATLDVNTEDGQRTTHTAIPVATEPTPEAITSLPDAAKDAPQTTGRRCSPKQALYWIFCGLCEASNELALAATEEIISSK